MKKSFLKYLLTFIIIIFFIDYGCGILMEKEFKKINFSDYGTINKNLKVNAEVVVLGSSRAQHHYNPHELSKILDNSCYNLGLGGNGVFYNYAILKEIIKNTPPKAVVLDLSPNVIIDEKSYTKLNLFLPYYSNNDAFKEIIELNPKFSKLELISNLYIYNSTIYHILRSINKIDSIDNELGYKPLEGIIDVNNFAPYHLENEKMGDNKTKYLLKIIALCKENKIKLVSVISPTYLKFDRSNTIINKLDSILKTNDVKLYDFSDYPEFYKKQIFFKDQLHLNKEGANLFSKSIAKVIRTELIN
ncbi:hypothetical protein [Aureibaculum conchae]|uniref:hypothetical protein n=1 Tax=Aureibaculum sp. 2308TA14-22 TaxID=3108392 RepID=UPI003393F36A